MSERVDDMIAENARLRTALEWYANQSNYSLIDDNARWALESPVQSDKGSIAQVALETKEHVISCAGKPQELTLFVVEYCSVETNDTEYWNNKNGWSTNLTSATVFTEAETKTLNLPMLGGWVELPKFIKE